MIYAYLKQNKTDGSGFTYFRAGAETQEALDVKRSIYLSDDWQDTTEAEYLAESAERDARQGTVNGAEVVEEASGEASTATTTE